VLHYKVGQLQSPIRAGVGSSNRQVLRALACNSCMPLPRATSEKGHRQPLPHQANSHANRLQRRTISSRLKPGASDGVRHQAGLTSWYCAWLPVLCFVVLVHAFSCAGK
jgi:hypothetical protein